MTKDIDSHFPIKRPRIPSEDILPLEKFFQPEDLKWNPVEPKGSLDLKLKEGQLELEQSSGLLMKCEKFLTSQKKP